MAIELRLACCLCRRRVPPGQDMYLLDAEWQRRYPQMVGSIACRRCALSNKYYWDCRKSPDGHIPREGRGPDGDAWNHFSAYGTQKGLASLRPSAAALQGGAEYVAYLEKRWPGSAESGSN